MYFSRIHSNQTVFAKYNKGQKKGELPLSCQILHQHQYTNTVFCKPFRKSLWKNCLPQHEGRDCVEHHGGLCHSFNFSTCSFCWKKDRDTFAFLFEPKKATEPLRAGGSAQARARIQSYCPSPIWSALLFRAEPASSEQCCSQSGCESCWASEQALLALRVAPIKGLLLLVLLPAPFKWGLDRKKARSSFPTWP